MIISSNNVVACAGGSATRLESRPEQSPDFGELLLRLRVVGLCGTDLYKLSAGNEQPGSVLGHEVVGDVLSLGKGVQHFAVGDRIVVPHHVSCGNCSFCKKGNETMCEVFRENLIAPGGFADTMVIGERAVTSAAYILSDEISDKAAVFLEPAACVLRSIRRSGICSGDLVVIQGAGPMGLLHLLVLRAEMPETRVIIIDPVSERRVFAEKIGAHEVLTPEKANVFAQNINADAVFDTVGGSVVMGSSIELTRYGGTLVLFAHASNEEHAKIDLNSVFKFERRIVGTYSGALAEQSEIFNLIKCGRLDPSLLVTHTMPLDDFEKGVSLVHNRKALKVLFTPSKASLGFL